MAMGFEKESILIFMEMKEFVPQSEKNMSRNVSKRKEATCVC